MIVGRKILICAFIALSLGVSSWGDTPAAVTVPVHGQYWEPGAGGWLNYSGLMTFTWTQNAAGQWGMSGKFVGSAWCLNTGAGYTLYGYCADCVEGAPGEKLMLSKDLIALDGQGQPAFTTGVSLALTIPGAAGLPSVTVVALGSR